MIFVISPMVLSQKIDYTQQDKENIEDIKSLVDQINNDMVTSEDVKPPKDTTLTVLGTAYEVGEIASVWAFFPENTTASTSLCQITVLFANNTQVTNGLPVQATVWIDDVMSPVIGQNAMVYHTTVIAPQGARPILTKCVDPAIMRVDKAFFFNNGTNNLLENSSIPRPDLFSEIFTNVTTDPSNSFLSNFSTPFEDDPAFEGQITQFLNLTDHNIQYNSSLPNNLVNITFMHNKKNRLTQEITFINQTTCSQFTLTAGTLFNMTNSNCPDIFLDPPITLTENDEDLLDIFITGNATQITQLDNISFVGRVDETVFDPADGKANFLMRTSFNYQMNFYKGDGVECLINRHKLPIIITNSKPCSRVG